MGPNIYNLILGYLLKFTGIFCLYGTSLFEKMWIFVKEIYAFQSVGWHIVILVLQITNKSNNEIEFVNWCLNTSGATWGSASIPLCPTRWILKRMTLGNNEHTQEWKQLKPKSSLGRTNQPQPTMSHHQPSNKFSKILQHPQWPQRTWKHVNYIILKQGKTHSLVF